jgi:hypothetical protein
MAGVLTDLPIVLGGAAAEVKRVRRSLKVTGYHHAFYRPSPRSWTRSSARSRACTVTRIGSCRPFGSSEVAVVTAAAPSRSTAQTGSPSQQWPCRVCQRRRRASPKLELLESSKSLVARALARYPRAVVVTTDSPWPVSVVRQRPPDGDRSEERTLSPRLAGHGRSRRATSAR